MKSFNILSLLFFFLSGQAAAIEKSKIHERFFLVGIISGDHQGKNGIAVIRDRESNRSLAIRTGEYLPYSNEWRISLIEKNNVVVSDLSNEVYLTYDVASSQPSHNKVSRRSDQFEDGDYENPETRPSSDSDNYFHEFAHDYESNDVVPEDDYNRKRIRLKRLQQMEENLVSEIEDYSETNVDYLEISPNEDPSLEDSWSGKQAKSSVEADFPDPNHQELLNEDEIRRDNNFE